MCKTIYTMCFNRAVFEKLEQILINRTQKTELICANWSRFHLMEFRLQTRFPKKWDAVKCE